MFNNVKIKNMVTKFQYEFALSRIEELLPLVDDNTPPNDKNAVELSVMSDVVITYEKKHFPIANPRVLVTQKQPEYEFA